MCDLFLTYKEAILTLPSKSKYEKNDLLTAEFLIEEENDLQVFFASHNEYVNHLARIIIVGITPGWTQMEKSIRLSKGYLEQELPKDEILKRVKKECRFAGSLRNNLIEMLQKLELHKALNIPSSNDLFTEYDNFLHTVSLIRYPVFRNKRNYTGHQPPIHQSNLLVRFANDTMKSEIIPLKDALIIPLGKAVEDYLKGYIDRGELNEHQILIGFPHPSGANGHRHKQFEEVKEKLKVQIQNFKNRVVKERREK